MPPPLVWRSSMRVTVRGPLPLWTVTRKVPSSAVSGQNAVAFGPTLSRSLPRNDRPSVGTGGLTVKPDTLVTTSPSGFVTFTSRTPMAAAVSIVIATESCVDARTVVEFTVMPPPNEALAPGWKLEPVTETVRLVPAEPAFGDTLVIVGTAGRVTVVVADVPSAKFALSVKTDPPL